MPKLFTIGDVEAKLTKEPNIKMRCPSCSFTWFEEIRCKQYLSEHTTIVGGSIAPASDVEFRLLRCVKCSDLLEPRILRGTRDFLHKEYDKFTEELEQANIKGPPSHLPNKIMGETL